MFTIMMALPPTGPDDDGQHWLSGPILRPSATTTQTATSQHSLHCTLHLRILNNKTVHCALSKSRPIPHWQPNGNLRVQPWPDAPAICHRITWKTLSNLSSDNQQVIQQLPLGIYPRGFQWGRQPVGRPPTSLINLQCHMGETGDDTICHLTPLHKHEENSNEICIYYLGQPLVWILGHQKYLSRKSNY